MRSFVTTVDGQEVAVSFGQSGEQSGEPSEGQEIPITSEELLDEPETSNPILPTVNELFWGAVCFMLLWALMKWVLLPPVLKGMEKRDAKVRGDLDTAESARLEAQAKLQEYEHSLSSAKVEAVRIIEDARQQADDARKEVVAEAEAEVAARKAAAAAEVAEAKERALAELRGSVAGIAIDAAEAVMQKPLDRDAELQTIEDYVNRAGSQN